MFSAGGFNGRRTVFGGDPVVELGKVRSEYEKARRKGDLVTMRELAARYEELAAVTGQPGIEQLPETVRVSTPRDRDRHVAPRTHGTRRMARQVQERHRTAVEQALSDIDDEDLDLTDELDIQFRVIQPHEIAVERVPGSSRSSFAEDFGGMSRGGMLSDDVAGLLARDPALAVRQEMATEALGGFCRGGVGCSFDAYRAGTAARGGYLASGYDTGRGGGWLIAKPGDP